MRGIEEMIQFQCDYEEGACPQILERLVETNLEQTVGYSEDEYCKQAREKIKKACDAPEADVHFLVGGTQTNYVVIRSILRPYQGVISAVTISTCMKQARSKQLDTKSWHFQAKTEKSQHHRCAHITMHTGMTQIMSTSYSRAWSTFPIRRKMEQFTASLNYRNFTQPVKHLACHYSWTEQEWDMD